MKAQNKEAKKASDMIESAMTNLNAQIRSLALEVKKMPEKKQNEMKAELRKLTNDPKVIEKLNEMGV